MNPSSPINEDRPQPDQDSEAVSQNSHNPQNPAASDAFPWPTESLEAERKFGHPSAKFYPFVNKRVLTRQGEGVLWKVGEDKLGVVLDSEPSKVCFLPIDDVRPLPSNGGANP